MPSVNVYHRCILLCVHSNSQPSMKSLPPYCVVQCTSPGRIRVRCWQLAGQTWWCTARSTSAFLLDGLCGTVFRLLYGDQRWRCTLSCNNSRPICSTSDVPTNRGNIHHRPAVLWLFLVIMAPDTKLPTYLLTYFTSVISVISLVHLLCLMTECSIDLSSVVSFSRQYRHLRWSGVLTDSGARYKTADLLTYFQCFGRPSAVHRRLGCSSVDHCHERVCNEKTLVMMIVVTMMV